VEKTKIHSYKDLEVWQAGIDLVTHVYGITRKFPKEETFGLISQMQRATISIPSNIAEGHARASSKEFLQFISISLGSLAELETQLHISERLGYLKPEETGNLLGKTDCLGRMLHGLQRALRGKIKGLGPKGLILGTGD
jgi:four helix bundle protein